MVKTSVLNIQKPNVKIQLYKSSLNDLVNNNPKINYAISIKKVMVK